MKKIRLSGRERTVVRSMDFHGGNSGEDLLESTRMEPEDLVDVLNALLSAGYAEVLPYAETTSELTFRTSHFEINGAFYNELREALSR